MSSASGMSMTHWISSSAAAVPGSDSGAADGAAGLPFGCARFERERPDRSRATTLSSAQPGHEAAGSVGPHFSVRTCRGTMIVDSNGSPRSETLGAAELDALGCRHRPPRAQNGSRHIDAGSDARHAAERASSSNQLRTVSADGVPDDGSHRRRSATTCAAHQAARTPRLSVCPTAGTDSLETS